MVAGGDAIDDADVLRTGRTAQVLGHRVMAPSTFGAVRQRAGRSGPPGRGSRAADAAGRRRVLVGQGHRRVPPPWHPVLDHGPPDQAGQGRDRRHQRGRLERHRLPRRRGRPGGRDHACWQGGWSADRAPHPTGRHPGDALAGLASPRLRHRPGRHRHRPGRRPPPPRRGRAGHPRPQAGRRALPLPSGVFGANAAWHWWPPSPTTCCAGWPPRARRPRSGGGQDDPPTLHHPARPAHPLSRTAPFAPPSGWPWAEGFLTALARLRTLPLRTPGRGTRRCSGRSSERSAERTRRRAAAPRRRARGPASGSGRVSPTAQAAATPAASLSGSTTQPCERQRAGGTWPRP